LTNSHRRRVLFHANARELQHFSRLREDIHAQWDIRAIASKIVAAARQATPALMLMAAGKHEFEKRQEEVYGKSKSSGKSNS
jgi:thymidylate synthase ThyX